MSYGEDSFSFEDRPCFAEYEDTDSDCRACSFRTACRAEKRANQGFREKLERKRMPVKVSAYPGNKTLASVADDESKKKVFTPVAITHTDFEPHEGETVVTRVAKNVVLDAGVSIMTSLAHFLATFKWEPKERPPSRVIEQINEDEE